mmetsp:Transcript_1029/g.2337  ORF Transcript_1029/g.2337 Transcript_1029/m.2337 type:complete len:208 (+) Transcript_1029:3763-4386(+)
MPTPICLVRTFSAFTFSIFLDTGTPWVPFWRPDCAAFSAALSALAFSFSCCRFSAFSFFTPSIIFFTRRSSAFTAAFSSGDILGLASFFPPEDESLPPFFAPAAPLPLAFAPPWPPLATPAAPPVSARMALSWLSKSSSLITCCSCFFFGFFGGRPRGLFPVAGAAVGDFFLPLAPFAPFAADCAFPRCFCFCFCCCCCWWWWRAAA